MAKKKTLARKQYEKFTINDGKPRPSKQQIIDESHPAFHACMARRINDWMKLETELEQATKEVWE
jgi:hypothetical protein